MNRQEQLARLDRRLQEFVLPVTICLIGFVMLLGASREFNKTSPPSISWDCFVLLFAGIIFLSMLIIFPTLERLDVEKRLSYALRLLDTGLSDQKDIDHELARRAQLADEASEQHIQAQGAVKRALTEEEEEKLRGKEGDKKDNFNLCNKDFQDLCLWAESSGYKVLKTSKGKPSFRLYLSKSTEVSPGSAPACNKA